MGNNQIKYIIYAGILLFLGYSLVVNIRLFMKARQAMADVQVRLAQEEKRNTELSRQLSDASKMIYLERVARDTLGLAKEGELVLVLPPEEELRKLSPRIFQQNELKTSEKEPAWKQWLQLFI